MRHKVAIGFCIFFSAAFGLSAQDATPRKPDNPVAVSKFNNQLQLVFGRFSDVDLQTVFRSANAIRCEELVEGKGQWKPVAFFNDNRSISAWYHHSLEEVKSDLREYTFKGSCKDFRDTVQITTKFPIAESIDSFNDHKIKFSEIEVNVNAAVEAVYDPRLQTYSFDLPYMFLRDHRDGMRFYTLTPQRIADRDNYDQDVIDHWDCKAVLEQDLTYQFLICRVTLAKVSSLRSGGLRRAPFGASAYLILSDGKEGSASVRYSFDDRSQPQSDVGEPTPHPQR
jgi:hypothetical protein